MNDLDPNDGLSSALCFNAYRLNLAFGRFYQAIFAGTGLTYPKYIVLKLLNSEGPMPISALSRQTGAEAHTLSPLLKKMAAYGSISRERSVEDERRVVVALTDKGRAQLREAEIAATSGFESLGLDLEEMAKVVLFLEGTRSKLDALDLKRSPE